MNSRHIILAAAAVLVACIGAARSQLPAPLIVNSAQVKWVKAVVDRTDPKTPLARDCITTCANVGLSAVTAGDPTDFRPLLCGKNVGKSLCAVAVHANSDIDHTPHNVHTLPGTRYTLCSPNGGGGYAICQGVPCWAPANNPPVVNIVVAPPDSREFYRNYYWCGCLPNPLEFWGAWTNGPKTDCPKNYVKTNGDVLKPNNTALHFGAICRVKTVLPTPALPATVTDGVGLLGFVRVSNNGNRCVVQADMQTRYEPDFDWLCVREEMSFLPERVV